MTGYVLRALAGNNAQCPFTVVVRVAAFVTEPAPKQHLLGPLQARRPTLIGKASGTSSPSSPIIA